MIWAKTIFCYAVWSCLYIPIKFTVFYLISIVCGSCRTVKCLSHHILRSEGLLACERMSLHTMFVQTSYAISAFQRECNVFSSVNETWGNLAVLMLSLIVSLLASGLLEHSHVFWRRRGFGDWFCWRVGSYAFKASLLLLTPLKSPALSLI